MDKSHSAPEGFIIRRALLQDAPGIAHVHVESWKSSYRHILPPDFLDKISYEERLKGRQSMLEEKEGLHLVALRKDTSQIVGFCDAGVCREHEMPFAAELYALYLLQEYQHQSLGRQLFDGMKLELTAHGLHSLYLWVLEDNLVARAFYQKMGGTQVGQKFYSIAGGSYPKIAYGWQNLA